MTQRLRPFQLRGRRTEQEQPETRADGEKAGDHRPREVAPSKFRCQPDCMSRRGAFAWPGPCRLARPAPREARTEWVASERCKTRAAATAPPKNATDKAVPKFRACLCHRGFLEPRLGP